MSKKREERILALEDAGIDMIGGEMDVDAVHNPVFMQTSQHGDPQTEGSHRRLSKKLSLQQQALSRSRSRSSSSVELLRPPPPPPPRPPAGGDGDDDSHGDGEQEPSPTRRFSKQLAQRDSSRRSIVEGTV